MAYAGKLEQADLIDYIIPTYQNFDDMSYDISRAKTILKKFIRKYCKTTTIPTPSNENNDYALRLCGINGIYMYHKNNKFIKYMFCIKTDKVYVAETNTTNIKIVYGDINDVGDNIAQLMPFDFNVMLFQDAASPTYVHVNLLSPKH
jgi:hypothetical protein